ncbi:Uncharacterised protein [Enterobacter hormaechei]|nr:Uncharacterised protein [Enterobacter hormaechei]
MVRDGGLNLHDNHVTWLSGTVVLTETAFLPVIHIEVFTLLPPVAIYAVVGQFNAVLDAEIVHDERPAVCIPEYKLAPCEGTVSARHDGANVALRPRCNNPGQFRGITHQHVELARLSCCPVAWMAVDDRHHSALLFGGRIILRIKFKLLSRRLSIIFAGDVFLHPPLLNNHATALLGEGCGGMRQNGANCFVAHDYPLRSEAPGNPP